MAAILSWRLVPALNKTTTASISTHRPGVGTGRALKYASLIRRRQVGARALASAVPFRDRISSQGQRVPKMGSELIGAVFDDRTIYAGSPVSVQEAANSSEPLRVILRCARGRSRALPYGDTVRPVE
jgi:hypothetical protein